MTFKDKTFCASPHCKNKCGRKMSWNEKQDLIALNIRYGDVTNKYMFPVSYAYLCGEPKEEI